MPHSWCFRGPGLVAVLIWGTACGGASERSDASGGGAASASSGGSAGAPGRKNCVYEGKTYAEGASFPASDGCNSCSCDSGQLACTQLGCHVRRCDDLATAYSTAFDDATRCDPSKPNQCSQPIGEGLQCGCETFANPENADALKLLAQLQQEYYQREQCSSNVQCGACPPAAGARCSATGRCEAIRGMQASAS